MSLLHIRLFGNLDVSRSEGPSSAFATQKARELFAYLVLNRGRAHAREVLAGVFWGDRPEEVARKCLRSSLWRIRTAVGGAALWAKEHEVGFNSGMAHWLDVEEFESRVGGSEGSGGDALDGEQVGRLQEAVGLYRGDLLEGIYDDWCVNERERLRLLYLYALEKLMAHHEARQEWEQAIVSGQRLLRADATQEHVHRRLMRCHYRRGNRPAALRQFAVCAAMLREEFDVEPMEETVALWEEVRGRGVGPAERSDARSAGEVLARSRRLLGEVNATLTDLQEVARQMEDAHARLSREVGVLAAKRPPG